MMAICRECGASIADTAVFCGNCGAAQNGAYRQADAGAQQNGYAANNGSAYYEQPATPPRHEQRVYEAPAAAPRQLSAVLVEDARPPQGSRYAVVGAWGFFWSITLLNLPVIGWVFTIVWACGGVHNYNLQRLARSYLIGWAAIFIIFLVIFLIGGASLGVFYNLLSYL